MSDTASEANTSYRTSPDPDQTSMPGGIPYIVGNEAAERFSFYGMKAILAVFLTEHLFDSLGNEDFLSNEQTKETIAYFNAAVYATPFIGAIIADRWLGKYKVILWLSLFYCLGHGVLALVDTSLSEYIRPRWIVFTGLALIACGAGGIKPCVTSHVGDQFGQSNKHLMSRVYNWFYLSINLGAFTSMIITPILLNNPNYGAAWAFGVPGVLMAIATFAFWLGRHTFIHIPPAGPNFLYESFGPDGRRAMLNLTPLLLFVAMFWSLFDQTASAWVIQAKAMNRDFNYSFLPQILPESWLNDSGGLTISPSQLQSVNSLFVLTLIPIFTLLLYPFLEKFVNLTPLRKIGSGLFIAVFSFVVSAFIEQNIQAGITPHVAWQILAYFILTVAEIMISITMLEFFYTQSPPAMKSVIMAFCMLSISIGNLFTAQVNRIIVREDGSVLLPGASYYWFFAGMMLFTAIAYLFWSQGYRGKTYIQGEEEANLATAGGEA